MNRLPSKATLTYEQNKAIEIARIGAMSQAGFYAHFYYDTMIDWPTFEVDTLATDGRRHYWNPDYLVGLEPGEKIFAFVHEIVHGVDRHPSRIKHYLQQGHLRQLPFYDGYPTNLANQCADYVINAGLVEDKVGQINPNWLLDPKIKSTDFLEDVFVKKYERQPTGGNGGNQGNQPQPGQGPAGQPGTPSGNAPSQPPAESLQPGPVGNSPTTAADSRVRGRDDKHAVEGRFDQVVTPFVDPLTGAEDALSEGEYKEAIAKAYKQAKEMGTVPGSVTRRVEEIMNPQIDWRDHVRQLLLGRLGRRRETYERPNRRRLVLNPIIIIPGQTRFGAKTVVVAIDCSGSITQREYDAFYAEVGSVLESVRPYEIIVLWCDTYVRRVERVRSLTDIEHIRMSKAPGGGGSDFRPVFEYIRKEQIKPETLILLTDGEIQYPKEAPAYPAVWVMTTEAKGPFGDTVHLKL